LALVSCGSYVSEWSDNDNQINTTNTITMPIESLSNVISIVYRDGCYTYFRASLLLRRIVSNQDDDKMKKEKKTDAEKIEEEIESNINKFFKIPNDEQYSDTGTAIFPVRFQYLKVGSVKVHAKLKEKETIRKSMQLQFKKIRTYGPCGVVFACLAMYCTTWLMMLIATVLSVFGYGLFRPLNRELELTIVPSNSWRERLDELKEK